MATENPTLDIDSHYPLTKDQISRFRRDGFIKLKNVLSPEVLAHYGRFITSKVQELKKENRPIEQRDTYAKAFLQVINIWLQSEEVKRFVMGKRLGRIAAELMGTAGVRIYHDQALYKEPGGGFTPWHVDQYYWPLASNYSITAWVPLQAIPMEMGPLEFSVGSQQITFGRDLKISDESEQKIQENLKRSDLPVDSSPFELGEVSFHLGYTFHRAGPNTTDKPREVMTVIYIDEDMKLNDPRNQSQERARDRFLPGGKAGDPFDGPLNPIVYSSRNS